MKKIVKELAKKAGFILWEDEDWKPRDEVIDWSCSYDKELERFFKLAVNYAKSERKLSKQSKCNMKTLEKLSKEKK